MIKLISGTLLILLASVAVASSQQSPGGDLAQVVNGTGHNFERDGLLSLKGNWDFYYHQLLTPKDFATEQYPVKIKVPGSWHNQGSYPVLGYATYRIQLTLPTEQRGLSLHIPIVNASAKIWINGQLVQETGKVSMDPASYSPSLKNTIVALPDHVQAVDIIIQVANYSYTSGGIGSTPEVDKSSAIFARISTANGIEDFFAGCLIAMFVYQIILYFLFDRGKPYLWLSLICLGVALRALVTHGGSFLLPNLYPSVSWEAWKKIEFGSVYAMVGLFPAYIYYLFPANASRKVMLILSAISGLLFASVLVTSQPTYGLLLDVCHVALIVAFGYAVYSVSMAWKSGNKDARIILFGVVASFPFILAEILKNSLLISMDIQFMYLVELGVLVFLLFQVYLLANHYAKSYKSLETSYQGLEVIVAERTNELTTANTVKNRLLSVMSHDVRSPLNSLRDLLHLYNKGAINKGEFEAFVKHVENDLVKTSHLVENVLFWTARQLKGSEILLERFNLNTLLEETLHLFQTMTLQKNIQVHHDTPKNFMIKADKHILNFVIRNLVSNAIKFSSDGGVVAITAKIEGSFLSVYVRDGGVGMDEPTLQSLLKPKGNVSTSGTGNEKGTGLGVALCREYLLKAGGQLSVESAKGQGSTFSFLLPATA